MSTNSLSMNSSNSMRTQQKEETRLRIVHQATRLVAKRGFAATKTADVAKKAGLSHGAVFVHFPTRAGLVLEVASRLGREMTDRLHELASSGHTLREVLHAHLTCIEEREDLYRHLLIEGPSLPAGFRTIW